MKQTMKTNIKPTTKSHSGNSNVLHSLLLTLALGASSFLAAPATAIAQEQASLLSNVSPPNLFVLNDSAPTPGWVNAIDATTQTVLKQITVGLNPIRLAITPDGSRVYVSNQGENTVSVINTQTGKVAGTLAVEDGPGELTVSPDGHRLYVAHEFQQTDGVVEVFDLTTNQPTLLDSVPIHGTEAKDVLVTPDNGTVYVANTARHEVDLINAMTYQVTAIPTTKGQPRRLAISGNRVFATIWEGYLTVIENGQWRKDIQVDPSLNPNTRGIAITPTGNKIYVTNVHQLDPNGSITVVDNASLTAGVPMPVGKYPWQVTITPNNYAYVSNSGGNTVTIFDTSNDSLYGTRTVGNGPFFSVVNPSHTKLYVSNSLDTTVSVINLASQMVLGPINGLGNKPFDLMFRPPQ
jgi:YVTN family beta-propeller protein